MRVAAFARTDSAGAGLAAAVARAFAAERDRWALWLPALAGAGIAVYFALPAEPPLWLGPAGAVVALGLAWTARGRPALPLALIAAGALAVGFAAAEMRSARVAAPVLAKPIGPIVVEGRVVRAETRPRGARLLLDELRIARLAASQTPARVRVRVMVGADGIGPGDRVALLARLSPPPGPAAPGAFDFARRAWFQGLGAVGFSYGKPKSVAHGEGGSFGTALARLRAGATQRVRAALAGDTGAMAAALMTGERGAISEATLVAMRNSGLAHLLAISGLHMGLVAGIVFFFVRLAFAAFPVVALRHPIKKWAAGAALAGALFYLAVSGATVPTQRAFVMVAIVLLAVLLDRAAISMRLVAWAAAVVLLLAPESLTGPSFQMSFAAVIALIASYEVASGPLAAWRAAGGWERRAAVYLAGIVLSSAVATAATAPFAAYHFNRLALYGLAANLAAVPLTALWIMPWAMVAFLLMPLGLEGLALAPMGWGVDGVIAVARHVAAWPGAVVLVKAMPTAALALIAAGGLWLCLWRGRWRAGGLAGIALGLALAIAARPPDLLVDGSGRLVALRQPDGALALNNGNIAKFDASIWLRRNAQWQAAPWPAGTGPAATGQGLRCDPLGCIWHARGRTVALDWRPEALAEDCAGSNLVISREPAPWRLCRDRERVIDRWSVWKDGAHAVWLSGDGIRIESVRGVAGERPWVPKPEQARRAGR